MDTTETYIKMEQGLPDKSIPHTAVAYLAGLIDGEGTISLRRKTGDHFNIEVYITSTNKPMLEWVQRTFGGKIYTYDPKDGIRQLQHKWHVHSKGAESILRLVQPFLTIKGEHCEIALEFRRKMNRHTSWHREFANQLKGIQKTATFTEPSGHRISQDQLQEMVRSLGGDFELVELFFNYVWGEPTYPTHPNHPDSPIHSMEQLWFSFVMKEKYNKVWVAGEWITNGLEQG